VEYSKKDLRDNGWRFIRVEDKEKEIWLRGSEELIYINRLSMVVAVWDLLDWNAKPKVEKELPDL